MLIRFDVQYSHSCLNSILIGPLHDPVTWYKCKYTGEQVAQWDFQNNAPAFVWKSHCATCSPTYLILYHVTGSCQGPIRNEFEKCQWTIFDIKYPKMAPRLSEQTYICGGDYLCIQVSVGN